MRYRFPFLFAGLFFIACNNQGKDSIEQADSANHAKLDSGLIHKEIVIDEESSGFLVRVSNAGRAETAICELAGQQGFQQPVKDIAAMLYQHHKALHDSIRALAAHKQVILPVTLSEDKQKELDHLRTFKGEDFDREFLKIMAANHEASITLFEKAILDTKDPDVRSFADKTVPLLRTHLDAVKTLQKKY